MRQIIEYLRKDFGSQFRDRRIAGFEGYDDTCFVGSDIALNFGF